MLTSELQITVRRLSQSRLWVLIASLVLALGLGANLVLFNTIYALLWRPLDVPDSQNVITILTHLANGETHPVISGSQASVLREQVPSVLATGLVSASGSGIALMEIRRPSEFPTIQVNSDYFRALQLAPIAGRFFGPEEDRGENAEERAVLVESAWRAHFGSDRSIIDRVLSFQNGDKRIQVRILGIAPDRAILFNRESGTRPLLFLPIPYLGAKIRNNKTYLNYTPVLLLKPDVTNVQVETQVRMAFRETDPSDDCDYTTAQLRTLIAPVDRRILVLVYGASSLLLLLTCANLASVFLARSLARTRETAIRMFLGVSIRQLLESSFQEALIVCIVGTTLALGLVRLLQPLVMRFVPQVRNLGREALSPGLALIGVALAGCVAIALTISTTPIWVSRRTDLRCLLADGGREKTAGTSRWRRTLIASQIAIVLTLLTASALVSHSFIVARSSDPGFQMQGVVTFHAVFPIAPDTEAAGYELSSLISALPGVERVAFANDSVIGPAHSTGMNSRGGKFKPSDPIINFRMIGGPYLEVLGAQLRAGRTFTEGEVRDNSALVIINERASHLLFGGEDPLGRIVHIGLMDSSNTVIGVVADMREQALDREPAPMVYMPYMPIWPGKLEVVVKTRDPNVFIPLLKSQMTNWNNGFVIRDLRPLADIAAGTIQDRLISSTLLVTFGILGLVVSCFGLYGTLSAQIQQRRREIGLRIAMGATPGMVMRKFLAEGLHLVSTGALVGLLGAVVAARLLKRHLYGVPVFDVFSFSVALVLLTVAALLSCLIPALEAARQNPAELLKIE